MNHRNEIMTLPTNHRPVPKRWQVHPKIPKHVNEALNAFSPLMRQLLYNRGIEEEISAADFISGNVSFPTDPFLIKDMEIAVDRLHVALLEDESITVYGDYDADGVTSSALLVSFLSSLGKEARVYIPNRYDEGYGLNDEAIQQLADEGTTLLITVDCGIRAVSQVALANRLGMDVIITDHHQPGEDIPPAVAAIDPKQVGDSYPEKFLAGVGLAYKLVQAYLDRYPHEGLTADDWLDLVAIGTVADLAPLKGENRKLVWAGIKKIRHQPRPGVFSLGQVAGIDLRKCDSVNIGFGLGPRLNAAGRLESALAAFRLLVTEDIFEAGMLAQKLDDQNSERKNMTKRIRELAVERVLSEDPDAVLFFAADPDFSEGVVGLAASRLTEAYYRPAIIAHQGEEFTVASCRSIPEFHITRALDTCTDLLVKHGGHAASAGFTIRNEDLPMLIDRLNSVAEEELRDVTLMPTLFIDREIRLDKLGPQYIPGILEDLHQLEPTGRENPEALFASYHLDVKSAWTVGSDGTHLKLTLGAGKNTFDAIAFRQGYWAEDMPAQVDIAYRFEMNEFNGRSSLQLNVKDIKASE